MHRDAQLLNAFVQEKVGSGFDIACSVYGSQVYQRFTNVKELTEVVSRMQQGFKDSKMAEEVKEAYLKYRDTFDFKLKSH